MAKICYSTISSFICNKISTNWSQPVNSLTDCQTMYRPQLYSLYKKWKWNEM